MLKLNKREAKCLLDNIPTLGLDQERSSELTKQEADELIEKLYQFTVKEDTFITRMEQELQELTDKLTKLHVFNQSDSFKSLSDLDRDLLNMQYCNMYAYNNTLNLRINLAKQASKNV